MRHQNQFARRNHHLPVHQSIDRRKYHPKAFRAQMQELVSKPSRPLVNAGQKHRRARRQAASGALLDRIQDVIHIAHECTADRQGMYLACGHRMARYARKLQHQPLQQHRAHRVSTHRCWPQSLHHLACLYSPSGPTMKPWRSLRQQQQALGTVLAKPPYHGSCKSLVMAWMVNVAHQVVSNQTLGVLHQPAYPNVGGLCGSNEAIYHRLGDCHTIGKTQHALRAFGCCCCTHLCRPIQPHPDPQQASG
mmetsp:Transcript_137841/g.238009  ORF Transcript_137841/g.238009 Transcript_137841/m.238009 type:complete len:249 (+) Transcript_137841:626-1372(+)